MHPAVSFILGLILGGIVGVMADRIWERYERVPRLTFHPSISMDMRAARAKSLKLDIKNVGGREIPDYQIVLAMDQYGTCELGGGNNDGPLLPTQLRKHEFTVEQLTRIVQFFDADRPEDWGPTMSHRVKTMRRPRGMSLQLVVKHGDKIIFASDIMGEAFAETCVYAAEHGTISELDWPTLRNN